MKTMVILSAWMLSGAVSAADDPAQILAQGGFVKKFQKIEGTYTIRQVGEKRVLEFSEDFKTKKGPDLQIIFSHLDISQADNKNAGSGKVVNLGLIKSHKGRQSFDLPKDMDLSQYKSVLIHCVEYSKLWGGANLTQ